MKQTKNQCLSKELDDTKRNQVEISELKNTVIEKGMDRTEKRVNLKKEQYKFPSLNIEREWIGGIDEQKLRNLWDKIKSSNIHITGVTDEEEKGWN